MLKRALGFALVLLLSGAVLADDARRLRVEAATLVHAAENADSARERQALLEQAHGKLVEIQERYPSASVQIQLYLGGKPVTLSSDDLLRKARFAVLEAVLEDGDGEKLRKVLGRELSPTAEDENGWTDLHWAAALNRPGVADALLDAGADLAARTKNDGTAISSRLKQSLDGLGLYSGFTRRGYRPLHIAAFNDARDVTAVLVERGADIHAKDAGGWTPLHAAAQGSAREAAAELIERGADIHAKDAGGWTPLHAAAQGSAREAAAELIERGADIHAKDGWYQTPLHIAAQENAPEIAAELIERGADVGAEDNDGKTPLHVAAEKNAREVAVALIERDADIHAKDALGWTPLHVAAAKNAREVAVALIEHGADVRAKDDNGKTPHEVAKGNVRDAIEVTLRDQQSLAMARLADFDVLRDVLGRDLSPSATDENGWTDLHWAAALNHQSISRVLLDAGADFAVRMKDDGRPLSNRLKQSLDRLGADSDFTRRGYRPLHIAAFNDARDVAAVLVERGADIHAKTKQGSTPLHAAAQGNAPEAAAELIERGADVGAEDNDGKTPLHVAAEKNAREVAVALIERGADGRAKDDDGKTPHEVAKGAVRDAIEVTLREQQSLAMARLADFDLLRDVLGRDLSPSAADENGWTDLHWAAALNHQSISRVLLDAGADFAVRMKDDGRPLSNRLKRSLDGLGLYSGFTRRGYRPLHIAAFNDARDVTVVLVERGANINAKGRYGWNRTPLHSAAQGNAPEAAAELIERGANIHAKNKDGRTPLHIAAGNNAREAAAELIERGANIHAKTKQGSTPLHDAAWENAREAAAELIERGANIHAKNKDGWTPLHFAAWENAREAAAELIERGANIHAKTKQGSTPLHAAAGNNAREAAAELIERGANIHAKNKNGRTPLHFAAWKNAREAAAELIERGARHSREEQAVAVRLCMLRLGRTPGRLRRNSSSAVQTLTRRTRSGSTPLHAAAWKNAREVAAELIKRGADINARDHGLQTPLGVAAQGNAREVAAELTAHGAR